MNSVHKVNTPQSQLVSSLCITMTVAVQFAMFILQSTLPSRADTKEQWKDGLDSRSWELGSLLPALQDGQIQLSNWGQQCSVLWWQEKSQGQDFRLSLTALGSLLLVLDEACYWELQISPGYGRRLSSHLPGPSPASVVTEKCHLDCFPFLEVSRNLSHGEPAVPQPYLHLHFTYQNRNWS